jgi:hypothetical protein
MSSSTDVLSHVLGRIKDAPLVAEPFSYCYIEHFFPDDFYETLLKKLPDDKYYRSYHAPYEARLYIELGSETDLPHTQFWQDLVSLMTSQALLEGMARKFGEHISSVYCDRRDYIEPRRSRKEVPIGNRLLLTRDYANYSISPHTDAPPKFITALIYLAKDESMTNFGTSVYVPKDATFRQWGADRFEDAHLPYERFNLVDSMSYRPNSAVVFLKTDVSFHGVEPSSEYSNAGRDMLMWLPEVGVNQRSWGSNSLPLSLFYGDGGGLISKFRKLFA